MDKETFEKWANDNNWLQVDQPANPNGRQLNFVTPTGNFVAAVFNLEGKLLTAVPLPPMIQIPPQMQGRGFPGFPGPTIGKS